MLDLTPEHRINLEARCKELGFKAPRVTLERVKAAIAKVDYNVNLDIPKTECIITLVNGHKLIGNNLIVSHEVFNEDLSKELAYRQAFEQIWGLEAYALRNELLHNVMAAETRKYSNQEEMVLCLMHVQLLKCGIDTITNPPNAVVDFDIFNYPNNAFTFLPRSIADNKSESSIMIGRMTPQTLGYIQVVDIETGEILTYRRKGKEAGLLGKYSIGVGGHVSLDDAFDPYGNLQNLAEIIGRATHRELSEELNIPIENIDFNLAKVTKAVYTDCDATSTVHLGLIGQLFVYKDDCKPADDEYCDVQWLTPAQLQSLHSALLTDPKGPQFEAWSRLIIESM